MLYKLFLHLFNTYIRKAISEHEHNNSLNFYKNQFPVGSKIIFQKNEPFPLIIGDVIGYELNDNDNDNVYLCKIMDTKGETHIINGPVLKWNPYKEASIRKLQWWERFNLLNDEFITKEDADKASQELRLKDLEELLDSENQDHNA